MVERSYIRYICAVLWTAMGMTSGIDKSPDNMKERFYLVCQKSMLLKYCLNYYKKLITLRKSLLE